MTESLLLDLPQCLWALSPSMILSECRRACSHLGFMLTYVHIGT
jgi:hypothetical protein